MFIIKHKKIFVIISVFLVLFFENTKGKIFVVSGISLMVLSYLTITTFKKFGVFDIANKIADLFEFFWPVVLITFGISIFINRKK